MLKTNNQDDCCLYINVFNYQYGFFPSQFVPALLWMETPLLSNGNHVSTLQLHFRAINSINLADPTDKAAKKKTGRRKQRRECESTEQGKQTRARRRGRCCPNLHKHQFIITSCGQAPETQSSLLGFRGRSCLPPSPFPSLCGTPKKEAQPPEPPGVGQGAGWQCGTDLLLCWSFPWASHASRFYCHISTEYLTLLIFLQL